MIPNQLLSTIDILVEIAVTKMSVIIYPCEQYHITEDLNHQLVVCYTLCAIIRALQKMQKHTL